MPGKQQQSKMEKRKTDSSSLFPSGKEPRRKKQKHEDDSSCSLPSDHEADDSMPIATVRPFVLNSVSIKDKPAGAFEAVRRGDVEAFMGFINQGVHVDSRNSEANCLLHIAVVCNREEIVKLLLETGASISSRGRARYTPLHIASFYGRVSIVRRLIEAGASVNALTVKGQTPLLCACMSGHYSIVQLLLESGANFSTADYHGVTPLMYAICQRDADQPAFDSARQKEYTQIALQLIEMGVDVNVVNVSKESALHIAAEKGNFRMIRVLRTAGADQSLVDTRGRTPLDVAAVFGHTQAVAELLEYIPEGEVPLRSFETAACYGHVNVMKFFFNAFTPESFYASHALCNASKEGRVNSVKLLIEAGFDVNKAAPCVTYYRSPLHAAAAGGSVECLRELLRAGANVDGTYSEENSTALHVAAMFGHKSCIEELLKYGAKHLLCRNKYPWQWAQNNETRQLLLDHQYKQS